MFVLCLRKKPWIRALNTPEAKKAVPLEEQFENIKQYISLKNTTGEGDIVIVGTPAGFFYALVRAISPDIKKDWYSVELTALAFPPADFAWTLRYPQMCGEMFTLSGEQHCMAAVAFGTAADGTDNRGSTEKKEKSGNVVPFSRKSKR